MRLPRHATTIILLAVGVLAAYLLLEHPEYELAHAAIAAGAVDPRLEPREFALGAGKLEEAVMRAARRIRNWEYVGSAGVGEVTLLTFVRHARLFDRAEDVLIRIEPTTAGSRLTGESCSRTTWLDLGQNARNLRRILLELDQVLGGSSPTPRAP